MSEYTITYWLDKNDNGEWEFVVIKYYGTVLVNMEVSKDPSYIIFRLVNDKIEFIGGPNKYKIDDVRIYATALSEEDIKELYMTRASLDDHGNLYMSQLNNLPEIIDTSITEKGIAKAPIISELGITDGLVAYYPLDGNAKDYSGNMNHGTTYGATSIAGIKNQSYSFDGIDDYISKTTSADDALDIKTSLTISCWCCPVGFSQWSYLVSKNLSGGGENQQYGLAFNNSTGLYLVLNGSTFVHNYGTFSLNKWYSLSMTWDGNILRSYVDGTEIGSSNYSGSLSFKPNFSIGRRSNNTTGTTSAILFNGLIDEVRIYNRALSPEEIKIQYDLYKPGGSKMKITNNGIYISGEFKEGL